MQNAALGAVQASWTLYIILVHHFSEVNLFSTHFLWAPQWEPAWLTH